MKELPKSLIGKCPLFIVLMVMSVVLSTKIKVLPNQEFYLEITSSKDNLLTVTLERSYPGWLGIGWGPGMKNSDMNIGVMQNQTNFLLHDLWSIGYGRPKNDSFYEGGRYDLTNIKYLPQDPNNPLTNYKITYSRKFDTGDPNDFTVDYNTNVTLFIAYGNQTTDFGYHGNKNYIFTQIYIDNKTNIVYFDGVGESSINYFYFIHGIVLSAIWTLFNFIGFIAARYLKHHKRWGIVHQFFNGITVLTTIVLSILTIIRVNGSPDTIYDIHHIGGFVILGLSVLQAVGGNLLYYLILSQKKVVDSHSKLQTKKIHAIIGYLMYFVTKVQIYLGFIMFFPDLIILPIIVFSLDVILIIFIELYVRFQNNHKFTFLFEDKEKINFIEVNAPKGKVSMPKVEDTNNSLNSRTESFLQISNKVHYSRADLVAIRTAGIKFVLYDNYLVEIGDFMKYHPGGFIHIDDSLYQDISRFVTGTVALNGRFMPYSHSFSAFDLIHKRIFGILKENHQIIINGLLGNSVYLYDVYQMTNKREIARKTFEFSFKPSPEDKNLSFKFTAGLKGYSWIGRHFSITSKSLNKTRFYSVCLCLNEYIMGLHTGLVHNLNRFINAQVEERVELRNVKMDKTRELNDHLQLYVKQYNFPNALSNYLANYRVDEKFDQSSNFQGDLIINGPLGVGLNLDDYLSGVHVAFAGGTGAFCFLDFVAFVFRLMAYRFTQSSDQAENFIVYHDEHLEFEKVNNDFKLVYFQSYSDEESAVYMDILNAMQKFEDHYKRGIFKFISRISSKNQERWTKSFITRELEEHGGANKIKRVFICGPTNFIDDINSNIKDIVEKSKIHLV